MKNPATLNKTIKHNLAKEEHFDFLTRTLGGEQLLRQKYPDLYKILLYTKEKSVKTADSLSAGQVNAASPFDYGLSDSMKIRTLNYAPYTTVSTASSIDLVEKNPSLIMIGELKDITHNELIDGFAICGHDTHALDGNIEGDSRKLIRGDEYEFLAETTFSRIVYDGEGNPFLKCQTDHTNARKVVSSSTLVKCVTVENPDSIKHPGASQTVIYYNNRKGPGCDYYYDNVGSRADSVDVYIPFSGSVEFNDAFKPSYVDKNTNFKLQIENINNGVANFNTSHWNEIQWKVNGSTLSWKFPDCWYDILSKNNFAVANDVNFYCQMYVTVNFASSTLSVPIVISSRDYEHSDPSFHKIKKLYIEWGCFARGTKIRMSDGSLKQIQDIKAGDHVRTENGSAAVTEVITGTEQDLVFIKTPKGSEIKVTKDHPVLTGQGFKAAGALNAGDILKMEYGDDMIAELHYVTYGSNVFSIRIDSHEPVIAEGFYMGDFGCQNRLKENPPQNSSLAKEGFQQELEDLIGSLNKQLEERRNG